MNIQERINNFTEKMCVKKFMYFYIKLEQLDKDIRRHIKNVPNGKNTLQFTSYDLRRYAMALGKVHKALNRKLCFVEVQKRIDKHDKITNEVLENEVKTHVEYMSALSYCQSFLSRANYWATIVYLIEKRQEYLKTQDDELFNDVALSGLMEAW